MNKLPSFVSAVVGDYAARLNDLHPGGVEGIYLTGSVALGDYHSNKSDIDFITLLREAPSREMLRRIGDIHRRIEATHHRPKLNGYYLTLNGIRSGQALFPSFFRNKMHFKRLFELDKLSLYEWKTSSYRIQGTRVEDLTVNVPLKDVLIQLHENINSYWTAWVQRRVTFGLPRLLLVLFPRLSEWGILGVARQLYTLETGKITSKLNAGIECAEKLPVHLKPIMTLAIETRHTNKTQFRPSFERGKKTLQCMSYIIAEFNKIYNEGLLDNKSQNVI